MQTSSNASLLGSDSMYACFPVSCNIKRFSLAHQPQPVQSFTQISDYSLKSTYQLTTS